MIYQSLKNPNSHLTIKERKWPSYPTKQLLLQNLLHGKVLDFGCGLGVDVRFLKDKGFDTVGYDPYYFPDYPTEKFDTILCHYVLNILLPEEQSHVLMAVSELLKPTGKAYFSVRRDIKKNGFRLHTKRNCQVYQCNVVLPYQSIIKAEYCEVYEYQPITQLKKDNPNDCLFCCPDSKYELVTESATVYAVFADNPISKGHTLIIPKQHADYFQLPDRTKLACWFVADRIRHLLDKPDCTFNFKVGQELSHGCIEVVSS